jgi:hypothetical protein
VTHWRKLLSTVLALAMPGIASSSLPGTASPIGQGTAPDTPSAGTLFVKHQRETVDGRLSACGLDFAVVAVDHSTRDGAIVKLAGRYDLRGWPQGGLGYSLKLGLYDGLGWTHPVAPHNAAVGSPRGPAARRPQRLDAQNAGYALFFDALDESFATTFRHILEERSFVIAFNRAPGERDVTAEVDLQVAGTRVEHGRTHREMTTETADDFLACADELFKAHRTEAPRLRAPRAM